MNTQSEVMVNENHVELFEHLPDPEAACALAMILELDTEEAKDIEHLYDDTYRYGNEEYLIGDDATMDDYWDDYLESYIDECILPELPEMYHFYFDRDKFKDDARIDGRAHSLATYDGEEHEEVVNGKWYYAYRTN